MPKKNPSGRNAEVLAALKKHGDALTQVREIDHYAYFPDEHSRSQFVAKCESAGFRLRRLLAPMKPGGEPGVLFFHRDIPDEDTIDRICGAIAALCEECGGVYDGWETQVVR